MCQNSLFPSRGTINNICITTAPGSQSYLLPSAASDNRGPPRVAFADHPVHVLFLGTSTPGPSLPTAQAPAGAQGQSVQSSRTECGQQRSSQQSPPEPTMVCRDGPCSEPTDSAFESLLLLAAKQEFRGEIPAPPNRVCGVKLLGWFCFFPECCSAESSRRGSWAVRILSLTAAKERRGRADKINFLHKLSSLARSTKNSSSWFGAEARGIHPPP